jgi:transposase
MMKVSTVGIDIAKSVFQLHGVDAAGRTVLRRRVSRHQLLEVLSQVEPCLIGMEACGGANHWARELKKLGHEVRLISPQFVKPYVKSNKNDAADAEAICEAVGRPNMRYVPTKELVHQDIQSVHRARSLLVKQRTAVGNQLRGLMGEYGVVVPVGMNSLRRKVPECLEDGANGLSPMVREVIACLYEQLRWFDERIEAFERRLEQVVRENEVCRRLKEIPGIGTMTATALYAAVNHAKEFRNGRHMAAWLGLVPRQHSSGGKPTLLGISKRGDRHLRTLLIHGARAGTRVARNASTRESRWVQALIERRGYNRATVALANKMARKAWVVLNRGERIVVQG